MFQRADSIKWVRTRSINKKRHRKQSERWPSLKTFKLCVASAARGRWPTENVNRCTRPRYLCTTAKFVANFVKKEECIASTRQSLSCHLSCKIVCAPVQTRVFEFAIPHLSLSATCFEKRNATVSISYSYRVVLTQDCRKINCALSHPCWVVGWDSY